MGYLLLIFGTENQRQCPTQPQWLPGSWCETQFQSQDPKWQKKDKGWSIVRCGLCTHQHTFFSRRVSVVHLWRWRGCDQDDRRGPAMRRVKDPKSCSWLVVRQNQFGTPDPNQICWHQKPTRWHSNWRKFFARRMESSSLFFQYYEFLDVLLYFFSDSIRLDSKAPCQNEVKRRLQMKALRWQSRDQQLRRRRDPLIWWGRLFTKFGVSGQSGDCRWTKKSGSSTWKQLAWGTPKTKWCTRKPVLGASKTEFQNMRFTNHQHMRSLSSCKRSWECQQDTQLSRCKHAKQMCWYGECSCPRRWKQPSILGRIT